MPPIEIDGEREPVSFWWLSFADAERPRGTQNLGCTIVAAETLTEALVVTHRLGINPGGAVQAIGIFDDGTVDAHQLAFMLNTLRSRDEMEAYGVI